MLANCARIYAAITASSKTLRSFSDSRPISNKVRESILIIAFPQLFFLSDWKCYLRSIRNVSIRRNFALSSLHPKKVDRFAFGTRALSGNAAFRKARSEFSRSNSREEPRKLRIELCPPPFLPIPTLPCIQKNSSTSCSRKRPTRFTSRIEAGRFLRASRAVAEYLDVANPDEIIGKTDFDFWSAETASEAAADEQRIMETQGTAGRQSRKACSSRWQGHL